MATARKHWFRVADSIIDEGWPDEIVATLVRLQAVMNRRWARNGLTADQAAIIVLGPAALNEVTNRLRLDKARLLARRCADVASISISYQGDMTTITWAKWPIFQQLPTLRLPESCPEISLSLPPPPPPSEKKKEQSLSKTREIAVASAPAPTADDPARWVSILGREPGGEEEKLAFVIRELPLALAEAEENHPTDRRRQRARIKSVLIRHYRWQRTHPMPMRAPGNGARAPVTFHAQSVENTKQGARDALAIFDAKRKEEDDERLRLPSRGGAQADLAYPPVPSSRR